MPNQYLRQDKNSRVMSPVTGVMEQPALPGQPIEIGNDGRVNAGLLPNNYDPCINVVADEAVQAGDLVYLVNVAGVRKIRRASSQARTSLSTLFVKSSFSAGAPAVAYIHGVMVIPNPGTYHESDTGASLYLHETIPGYVQMDVPNTPTAWIQRVAIITDVTPTEVRCFYIGFLDRGKTPGSSVIDTDPLVMAHIADTNNPHSTTAAQVGALAQALLGAANGVAGLGADSRVPEINLPLTQWKRLPVRVAVMTNVTINAPGAALDGVTLATGDRVLLLGQTATAANGIYVWNGAGVPMTRATDADSGAEVWTGLWMVHEGTQASSGWLNTNASTPTLGTTALTFTRVIGTPAFVNPMTTQGDLIVGSSNGTPARLPGGINGQVMTMVAGVPTWQTIVTTGMANPMTDYGDIIFGGSGGTGARIGIGSAGQVLTVVGGRPMWQAPNTGMPNPLVNPYDILMADNGGNPSRLGIGTNGHVLTMVSGKPTWQALTFTGMSNPMTASGDLIIGGTGGAAQRLPVGANGQVLTLVSGVPAWVAPNTGFANPMTTLGDLIVGGSGGQATRMGPGTNGQVLMMVAGLPAWANGMTNPMSAAGDLIVGGTGGTPAKLVKGANGQVLTMVAGVPAWAAPATGFTSPMTAYGDLIVGGSSGGAERLGIGTNGYVLMVVSGAPTWHALPSSFANPMTTQGDLISGGTTGTAQRLAPGANGQVLTMVAGVPAWANSASGFANPMTDAGDLIVGGSGGAGSRLAKGADGQVLTMVSGAPVWANNAAGFANPMSAAGDLIVGGTGGAAQRLAKGTDGQVLKMVSGVPAWAAESGGSGGGMTNPMTTQGDLITGGATGTPGRLAKGTDTQVLTMVSGSPAWADAPTGSGGSVFQISTSFSEIIIPKADAATATYNPGDGYPYLDKSYQWQGTPWEASVPTTPGATYVWDVWGGPVNNTYVDGYTSPTIKFRASVYNSIFLRCTKRHTDGRVEVAEKRIPVRYHAFKGTSAVGDTDYPSVSMPSPGGSVDGVLGTPGVGLMSTWGNAGVLALGTGELLFTDQHCLRKISADRTTLSTVCGGGSTGYTTPDFLEQTGTDARTGFGISNLCQIGNDVYFICNNSNRIAKVNLTNRYMSLVAGTGATLWPLLDSSPARAGAINNPSRMAAGSRCLYIVDSRNGGNFELIRKIDPDADTITTFFDAYATSTFRNRGPIMGVAVCPGVDPTPDVVYIAFEDEILMVTGTSTADHVAGKPKSQQDPWVKHRVGAFTDYDNQLLKDATFYSIYRMIWGKFDGTDQLIVGDGQGQCAIRTVDPSAIDARKVVTRYLMGTKWSDSGEGFSVDPTDGISMFMCGGNVFPHYITPSLVTAPPPDDWNVYDVTGDYSTTSLSNAGLALDETCPVTIFDGNYARWRVGTTPIVPGSINVVETEFPWTPWWGMNAIIDSECTTFPRNFNPEWANTYRNFNRFSATQTAPISANEYAAPARLRLYTQSPPVSWATAVPAFIPKVRFMSSGANTGELLGNQYWPSFQPSVSMSYDLGGNVQSVAINEGYPDGSTMTDSFTYDAEGYMLSWVKKRGDGSETLACSYRNGYYLDAIDPVRPSEAP